MKEWSRRPPVSLAARKENPSKMTKKTNGMNSGSRGFLELCLPLDRKSCCLTQNSQVRGSREDKVKAG